MKAISIALVGILVLIVTASNALMGIAQAQTKVQSERAGLLLVKNLNNVAESNCDLDIDPPTSDQSNYRWIMAIHGTLRDGPAHPIYLEPGDDVSCVTLGIDVTQLETARYLYIIKYEGDEPVDRLRIHPTGMVCGLDDNGDHVINAHELVRMRQQIFNGWCKHVMCSMDVTGDGVVNFIDHSKLARAYLQTCPVIPGV